MHINLFRLQNYNHTNILSSVLTVFFMEKYGRKSCNLLNNMSLHYPDFNI